jgi:hypothetical protein
MEQMVERLVAAIGKIDTNQAKTDASLGEMKAEMRTDQEEMVARLEAMMQNNQEKMEARIDEKFEVLRGTLISLMDIHQEKMEATIQSIWSELEEVIKHRVEDVLSCVDQRTQSLITS